MSRRQALAIAVVMALAACGGDGVRGNGSRPTGTTSPRRDLVAAMEADGRFRILLRLIRLDAGPYCCLGFESHLEDGLLTIFAPTDEAFASLPSEALPAMIEDGETLLRLIENHIVHGVVPFKICVQGISPRWSAPST